tara:strand:- start:53 stop:361 length:309 start_codon:yes stop_codon:yes gene_type:complete
LARRGVTLLLENLDVVVITGFHFSNYFCAWCSFFLKEGEGLVQAFRRHGKEKPSTGLGVSEKQLQGIWDASCERGVGCGFEIRFGSARHATFIDQGKNLVVD